MKSFLASAARGRVGHARHFACCHGERLQGQPSRRERKPDGRLGAPPRDDTGHTGHHPDERLFRPTRLGVRPPRAPAFTLTSAPGEPLSLADLRGEMIVPLFVDARCPDNCPMRYSLDRQERQSAGP